MNSLDRFNKLREEIKKSNERNEKRAEKAKTLWPKRVKKPKAKSITQLEAILWNIFSFYIRTRDKRANNGLCFYCETNPIQVAMHRIKRGKRATKYDETNCHGGCVRCNGLDGPFNQSQKFDAIFIRKLGQQTFLALEEKSRCCEGKEEAVKLMCPLCKRTKADIIEKTEYFKKKYEELLIK